MAIAPKKNAKLEAIALRANKYSDHHLIATFYSKEQGLVTAIAYNCYNSKKKLLKPSFFTPLNILDLNIIYNNKTSRKVIQEAKIKQSALLNTNIEKNIYSIFISEIIQKTIFEEETNLDFYCFLQNICAELNKTSNFFNLIIFFLIRHLRYLGLEINNIEEKTYSSFNLQSGLFEKKPTSEIYATNNLVILLKQFLNVNFKTYSYLKIEDSLKTRILNMLLKYYRLHSPNFNIPKSLQTIRDFFLQ